MIKPSIIAAKPIRPNIIFIFSPNRVPDLFQKIMSPYFQIIPDIYGSKSMTQSKNKSKFCRNQKLVHLEFMLIARIIYPPLSPGKWGG